MRAQPPPYRFRSPWPCRLLAVAAAGAISLTALAAEEVGLPLIRNFGPGDYHDRRRVVSASATPQGTMLFGTEDRILEFDGVVWRSIEVPDAGIIHALSPSRTGHIWVAGDNELGWLKLRPDGTRHYVSLRSQLPAEAGNLGAVREIHETDGGTWIQCTRAILHWQAGEFAYWRIDDPSRIRSFWLGDALLIARPDGWYRAAPGGLWDRVGQGEDQLRSSQPGLVLPEHEGPATLFLQNPAGEYLGLARFDGRRLQPQPHPLDDFFRRTRPNAIIRLPDGRSLVATALGGVAVLDASLQPQAMLDDHSGLESNVINALAADADGAVWLATDWGITRLDLHPAYAWFDAATGLPRGGAETLARLDGQLAVGGSSGILKLSAEGHLQPQFIRQDGIEDRIDQMVPFLDGWLAAGRTGLWQLRHQEARRLPGPGEVAEIVVSRRYPGRVYARMPQGLGVWRHDGADWHWEGFLAEPHGDLGNMAEDASGTLWIGASGQSVWQLRFPSSPAAGPPEPLVRRRGQDAGLPAGFGRTRVQADRGQVLFITNRGLYSYTESADHFDPDNRYGSRLADGRAVVRAFAPNAQDGGWFLVQSAGGASDLASLELGLARGQDWQPIPVPDISRLDGATRLHFEKNAGGRELLWVLGQSSLLRIDLGALRSNPPSGPGQTRMLRVTTTEGRLVTVTAGQPLRLQPADTTLHFEYATPGLEGESAALYESRLTGLGDGRPELDHRSERTYAGLRPGNYTFHVRARTADGRWSRPTELEFILPPPWWGTGWAQIAGGLLLAAGIGSLIAMRTHHLIQERNRLEQIVTARTTELARSNARLLQLNRIEHDEKLAARLVGERAQLELLRYQLNPHFLYNALNSIRALTFSQPEQAAEMVTHLSQFCRRTLSRGTEGLVPLAEEIGMLQDYLEIERLRWQESLVTELEVAPEAECELIPQFLLLPLVENAIKYGGRTSPGILHLRIRIVFEHGILLGEVANTGRWLDPATGITRDSTGIGLDNLRQRLATYYGPGATLEPRERDGWVVVRLRLPKAMQRGSHPPHSPSHHEPAHPTPAADR